MAIYSGVLVRSLGAADLAVVAYEAGHWRYDFLVSPWLISFSIQIEPVP